MRLTDKIYGQSDIGEPIFEELIGAPSFLRLKKLNQFGFPDRYYLKKGYTRYEHSIGVMLLLRHLGASVEEQIAGLLHDISHTAFSHVADYLLGDPTRQDFQDNRHLEILERSELKSILERYGYNTKRIADFELFTLLDRPMPELCADRLDYCLREMDEEEARSCFAELIVKKDVVVFASQRTAKLFAETYLYLQRTHWSSQEATLRYEVFVETLKYALTNKIITLADFDTDDETVLAKLEASGDPKIIKILRLFERPEVIGHYPANSFVYRGKYRYVDPLYLDNGKTQRLSEHSTEFHELLENEKLESGLV